jgi:hypothetical protein
LERIRAQWPMRDKRRRADWVIDSSRGRAATARGVQGVCDELSTGQPLDGIRQGVQ